MGIDARQSNTDALISKAPDAMKTQERQNKETVDGAIDSVAKYLPGQEKARDHMHPSGPHHEHGRADITDQAAALKPSGEQTLTEKVKTQADKLMANAKPNEQKTVGEDVKDAALPGHKSSATEGTGIVAGAAQMATDAKNAVVNALSTKETPAETRP